MRLRWQVGSLVKKLSCLMEVIFTFRVNCQFPDVWLMTGCWKDRAVAALYRSQLLVSTSIMSVGVSHLASILVARYNLLKHWPFKAMSRYVIALAVIGKERQSAQCANQQSKGGARNYLTSLVMKLTIRSKLMNAQLPSFNWWQAEIGELTLRDDWPDRWIVEEPALKGRVSVWADELGKFSE